MIVNGGTWLQASVATGTDGIRRASTALRRFGFNVRVVSMGQQITQEGKLSMTMIDVQSGNNVEMDVAECILKANIPSLQ